MASQDTAELLRMARELIELDRAFGVEFIGRSAPAAAPVPAPRGPAPRPAPAPTPQVREATAPATARAPAPPIAPAPRAPAPPTAPAPAPAPASGGAPAPAGDDSLERVEREVAACTACGLCKTRTRTVPGEGAAAPQLLFIGEAPGADEDAQGRPFVGAAGQLLDRMIQAMGFAREQVFIANVLKCRPPGNRAPEPDEVTACMGYLRRQVALLRPAVICTLGNVPLRALFGAEVPGITRARGKRMEWEGIPVIPTFHPSYLLRNEQAKKPAWEDLQAVLGVLGRTAPKKGGQRS
jgi:uracil-DNA glycosylase family 4